MRRQILDYEDKVLIRISPKSFVDLYTPDTISHLFISTTKGFNIMRIPKFDDLNDFETICNNYFYYNCNNETGNDIAFWFDVGDLKLSEFKRLEREYFNTKNLHYTTLVKRYYNI